MLLNLPLLGYLKCKSVFISYTVGSTTGSGIVSLPDSYKQLLFGFVFPVGEQYDSFLFILSVFLNYVIAII